MWTQTLTLLSLLSVLKQEPPPDLDGGNLRPLRDPETEAASLLTAAADGRDVCRGDGETELQNHPGGDGCHQADSHREHSSSAPDRHLEPVDQAAVRKLSQEVEQLTDQNQALNQRNQELLNQLTEADREIERLKAELSGRCKESRRPFPEEEQPGHSGVEDLERELSLRNQELLEAQSFITSLEETLREMEMLLQLNGPADSEGTTPEEDGVTEKAAGYLLQGLKAAEAELSELERQLGLSEETRRQLQVENTELKEVEKRHHQAAAEAEADIRRLNRELEEERVKSGGDKPASGADRIQQVMEETATRLNALRNLLEVIDKSDVGLRKEDESTAEGQLKWEEELWRSVHHELSSSELHLQEHVVELLSEATQRMMVEKQMLLLALSSETDEGTNGLKRTHGSWTCEMKQLRGVAQRNVALLNHLRGADALQPMADRVSALSEHPWSGWLHSAATEALYCCRLSRLQSKHQEELEELASALICTNCDLLTEEVRTLRAKLSNLEEQRSPWSAGQISTCCQTDEVHPQDPDGQPHVDHSPEGVQTPETGEETLDLMDLPPLGLEGQVRVQENTENSGTSLQETDPEPVLALRGRVMELEEQLSVREAELKQESDGKISSVQAQHGAEMEKLKVCGAW